MRYLSLLDTSIRKLPTELGNLRKLIVLEIDFLIITVSLPPAMGQLINLRKLLMSGSESRAVSPPELEMLSKLEDVKVEDSIIDHIPEGIFEGMAELR